MEAVAETPVNPITSAGVIDPTEAVAETPAGVTSGLLLISGEPTLAVAETPVMLKATLPIIVGDPTLEVEDTPVNPITSAGLIDPTPDVTCEPKARTTTLLTESP